MNTEQSTNAACAGKNLKMDKWNEILLIWELLY